MNEQTANLIAGPAIVITQDPARRVLVDAYVAVAGDTIVYAGDASGLPPLAPGGERIDATGQFIVPGLIDTHTHLYQTLMKGLGDDYGLMEWLRVLTIPTMSHLSAHDTRLGALVGLTEAVRSGTTSVLDFFVATSDQSLWDGISSAYAQTGIRGFLGLGLADNMTARTTEPLESQLDAIRGYRASGLPAGALVDIMLGPGSTWSMTPAGLARVREEADRTGMGITLHLNEAPYDNAEALTRHGVDNVVMLDEAGFLGPDVILAHCCYFTDNDIATIAERGATVSTNPVSNMYLGNQAARIPEMLERGVNVAIGPDGAASNNTQDMFEAMKMSVLVQTGLWEDAARMKAQTALDIATLGGARALRRDHDLGSIEPGKRADFFLFDPRDVRAGPWHDPVSTIVYAGGERNVTTTVVNGTVLMRDGRIDFVDEHALLAEAQEAATALSARAGTTSLLERRNQPQEAVA